MKKFLTVFLATCASSFVFAADFGGVKFDEKITVGGQELTLNGGGVRSRFVVKVYAAALYTAQKSSNAQTIINAKTPRRMQLSMLRDLSADQLADALKDGIDNNATQAELDSLKAEIDSLLGIMRGLKEAKSGQNIQLDFGADGKTTVSVNGAARGSVASEGLQKALLKIWLGDKPIQGDLKRGLLGS
jgi:long-chain acyl-CoA synthetase